MRNIRESQYPDLSLDRRGFLVWFRENAVGFFAWMALPKYQVPIPTEESTGEVTPEVEAKFNIAASFGPLSLSKPVSKTVRSVNADKLHTKFAEKSTLSKQLC